MGIEVGVRDLFEAARVGAVEEVVERGRRGGEKRGQPALVKRERSGDVPLSYAQQRLWFIDQLEGGSAAYNMPVAMRLRGDLNVMELKRALETIVERHEVLRTHLETRGGEGVQVIEEQWGGWQGVVGVSGLGREEREEEIQRLVGEEEGRWRELRTG